MTSVKNVTKDILLSLKERIFVTYGLLAVLMLISADLLADYDPSLSLLEFFKAIAIEVLLMLMVLLMGQFLWGRLLTQRHKQVLTERGLKEAMSEVRELREKQQALSKALNERTQKLYEAWVLSRSEKEIADLLLSSRSLRQISEHRFTSEGTVKNQVRAIYKKAQVKNRTEFMAAMLDNLTASS